MICRDIINTVVKMLLPSYSGEVASIPVAISKMNKNEDWRRAVSIGSPLKIYLGLQTLIYYFC